MALVKKDKSEEDLKRNCLEQLDVFLSKHTQTFVDMFFASIKSKSYLKPIESTPSSSSSSGKTTTSSSTTPSSTSDQTQSSTGSKTTSSSSVTTSQASATSSIQSQSSSSTDCRKKDDRSDRRRRSRSPGKRRDGWADAKDSSRNHWTDSKSRNRSKRSSRSRSRSPPRRSDRVRSRTPEKSGEQSKRKRSPSPDNRGHRKKERCRDYEEQGFCLKGDLCPFDHGSDPVVLDGIPFPNGANQQVPPPQPPLLPTPGSWPPEPYNPEAPAINSRPPPGMLIPPPGIMGPPPPFNGSWNMPPQIPTGQMPSRLTNAGNARVLSTIIPVSNVGAGHGDIQQPQYQVPMHDRRGGRGGGRGSNRGGFQGHHHHRRGGMPRRMDDPERRTLEVRKIPPELNTISKLNEYFGQFGEVTQIVVCHEGDREAALVTFASQSEAMAANRCPDAVLGNRFIKLFWHSKERQEPPKPERTCEEDADSVQGGNLQRRVEATGTKPSIKDRLGNTKAPDGGLQVTVQTGPEVSKPVRDPALLRKSNVTKNEQSKEIVMLPSEIKADRINGKNEVRKKVAEMLREVHEQRALVKAKYDAATTKTEKTKLLKLFAELDKQYKHHEETLKKSEEDIVKESARPHGRRGRGRGGYPRPPRPAIKFVEDQFENEPSVENEGMEDVPTGQVADVTVKVVDDD